MTSHRLIRQLEFHRWMIPVLLGAVGVGYTVWESVFFDGYSIDAPQFIFGILLLGLLVPLLAFGTLTWALLGARSWSRAEQLREQHRAQLSALNQELEQRVRARTNELFAAKETLAQMLLEERRVEEKTRAHIAHDLHDGIQQLIVGALYEVQAAREATTAHPEMVSTRLASALELLRQIETEMRGAIYSLRPLALDAHGLAPAIRECIARFERVAGMDCDLHIVGTPRRLTPAVEVAAFRIVQEALNNIQAHAQTRQARVRIEFGARELRVEIDDDGVGFDAAALPARTRAHLGLMGMRERAESVGGALEIASRVGAGTRICLRADL
ncbi:MAG: sensor histidine kinase [Chloroflexi bacterium]|nr:sensor histidine kinase [Chloroflexota bacterium]